LAETLTRVSSQRDNFAGGYWKKTPISSENILLSIAVEPERSFALDDALGILQRALPRDPLVHPIIKVPTREKFVVELKAGRGEAYVNSVLQGIPIILDVLCTSAKRQKREIDELVFVLGFSKSIGLIHEHLIQYLERCLSEMRKQSLSLDPACINRRIDGAIYVLFELTEKSAIQNFVSTATPILTELMIRGLQAPLFSRAVRRSFLKGIDFFAAQPALIAVIKSTDTDDARGFVIIQHSLAAESDLARASQGTELINRLSAISSKGKELLARDMRRTVPNPSFGPKASLAECIAWLSQSDINGHVRKTSYAKCLLLHYFNCLRPGLILWLSKNHPRIAMERNDVLELSALAGYDVPYIVSLNQRLFSTGLIAGLATPSRCSNIVEYFQQNLKNWKRRPRSREFPGTNTEQPLVSVLFTTYKPDIELFKLSLESILFQAYRNIEVIVIDDCSPLDTSRQLESLIGAIAEHHAHPVIYQRNNSNVRQYVSRNTAIALAKGEFIAIQDDDDISHPERLRLQIAPMLKDREIMATHANHIRISNNARIMSDGDGLGEIQGDAPVSFIWRRQVFKEIGSFLPTKTRGDIEFRTRMRHHYGHAAIQALRHPLVLVRGGMGTVSSDMEYYNRSALAALRYMMMHIPPGVDNSQDSKRWVPTLLE